MNKAMIRIPKDDLEQFVNQIFLSSGLDEQQSKTIAKHLVLANLRGVDSHGVSRVAIYTKRIELGLTNKKPNIIIEREAASFAQLNADNGSGIVAATEGIQLAVQKAKEAGIGLVAIHNSNHCGMLAEYTQYAAKNDCICLATTNAPANMAPWGGRERFFGTNPFSYGIPADEEMDIIFDMATSVVAKGKIINAHKNQQAIPLGWAITKNGEPTTDPGQALEGLVLPMGGPKGYGIAMMVDILSGIFSGAAYGPYIADLYNNYGQNQNVGQFFFTMRADLFQPIAEFKNKIDQMIREIRQIPLIEGVDKIYLPGEIERETMNERILKGIPLSNQVIDELHEVALAYNLSNRLYKMDKEVDHIAFSNN